MLFKITQESQGSCHGNQIWAKINQNCTNYSSAQEIQDIFARIVRLSRSAHSNMLSNISREPRELPWQPNLDKKKTKNACDIMTIFTYMIRFWDCIEFKYAI